MPKTKVRHYIQNIKIAWYKKEHSENKTELLEIKSTIVEIFKYIYKYKGGRREIWGNLPQSSTETDRNGNKREHMTSQRINPGLLASN